MANMLSILVEAPPDTLRVKVEYYDSAERQAFTKTLKNDLLGASSKVMDLPTPDFCTYYLYYKSGDNAPGYSSHDEVAQKWASALVELDGQLTFSGGSVRLSRTNGTSRGTTERFGEAIGLSVASHLHDLHEGDWRRIPESNKQKTLDFQHTIASDGIRFVRVEAKGASVSNNDKKPPAVSKHKKDIKAKKKAATPAEKKDSVLYGTIGVLDARPGSIARCYLVDPPTSIVGDPLQFKIMSRLEYIAWHIALLGDRSQLAAAIWSRLAALHAVESYGSLDGIALRTGANKEFSTATYDQSGTHNPWFASKSVVSDGPAGGHIFPVNDQVLFFLGIREQLVALAISQSFDEIASYKFPAGIIEETVECMVSKGRFKSDFARFINLPMQDQISSSGYFRFSLDGHLYYCQSGLVFGVLPIPKAWRTSP